MGLLSGTAVVLDIVARVLGIATTLKGTGGGHIAKRPPPFDPDKYNQSPLPIRSLVELASETAKLRTEWVTYGGATPPLKLKVTAQSYESYRRMARQMIDRDIGQENVERLSVEQLEAFNHSVLATAYVADWDGAQYPNGSPMPFSVGNLVVMMAQDPYLEAFIVNEARRISPPWPDK